LIQHKALRSYWLVAYPIAMSDPFYITTPIYYVNDHPHIGHAYTTVAADVLARYHRLAGKEVLFLTGTDEHGQKIQKSAHANQESSIALADRVVKGFEKLWDGLNISHDDFIRTTQDRHKQGAIKLFQTCLDQGDIYLGAYKGWYAVNDEAFLTPTQVQATTQKELEHDPNIVWLEEPTYFFRLSNYQDKLLAYYQDHPDFIQPASRRNEVLRFVDQGLRDLSVSRTSFDWGIGLPNDQAHVMYVWMDALSNYISALGYGSQDESALKKHWPAQVQLVGKDILRFHTVYWPAFLMSAGLPLPERVFAHGWWTAEGEKMSKSKGNFIRPQPLMDSFGVDAFRFFILTEFTFGQDGNFSKEKMIERLNAQLANELGNLVSRTLSMVVKYFEGVIPQYDAAEIEVCQNNLKPHINAYQEHMRALAFDQSLSALWEIVKYANQYIETQQPWVLAKQEDQAPLGTVLFNILECIRLVSVGIAPVMPQMSVDMRRALKLEVLTNQIGVDQFACVFDEDQRCVVGTQLSKIASLFQRIEIT